MVAAAAEAVLHAEAEHHIVGLGICRKFDTPADAVASLIHV